MYPENEILAMKLKKLEFMNVVLNLNYIYYINLKYMNKIDLKVWFNKILQ